MPDYRARIDVMLKPLVNDPQGLAVRDGLKSLGFASAQAVRVGKHIELTVTAESASDAEQAVHSMCDKLLANPVIEDYAFEVVEVTPVA